MHDSNLEGLIARVDALERDVAQLRSGIAATPPAPAVPPAAAIRPAPAVPPPPAARLVQARDVESIVGGRGLLYVGAFLIVVGVASFLKIAFDRGWIGPGMRVALGIVAGVILITGGDSLRKRLHPYFADTLIGLGAAIEYLSLYGAGAMFSLLPLPVVALGMIVVTGTLCVLAYRDDRQPLAHFGIVGGLLTPTLLGSQSPDLLVLFTYLAVLSAGAIALGELQNWRAVPIVALVGTAIYWLGFSLDGGGSHQAIGERLTIALILYALFASTTIVAWRRRVPIDGWRIAAAAINATWFFLGISALAFDHRALLAVVLLAVAAAHVAAGAIAKQRPQFWLATIALSFAIPPICYSFASLLPGEVVAGAMHVAWVVEATLVGVFGSRWKDRVLVALAGALFVAVIVHALIMYDQSNFRFLLNERFISLLAAAIGLAIVRRALAAGGMVDGRWSAGAKIAVNLLAIVAISPEARHFGALLQPKSPSAGGNVALSIAWALYGGTLIVLGIRAKDALSRWVGLALLALTVLKVFAVDLTDLDLVFRVVSALGLGIVLLALAYMYQTRLRASKKETP
ncbi:MAG: DUF2339 domain-containing protein [Candidatus Tumulicola sp.]